MPNDFRNDANANLVLAAPLDCTLWPDKGPQPTFFSSILTTPACPTVVDCFGRLRDALPGEALFYGARRVENYLRFSGDLSFTGTGGWFANANATITPVTDSRRPGSDGSMTAWKLARFALTNSVLRQNAGIRRVGRPSGLDLLPAVQHVAAINIRRSNTNVVNTAELRAYIPGGPLVTTKTVTIDDTLRPYAITFTPVAPRRITGVTWSAGVLTVTVASHGLATNTQVRLSGSLPTGFDLEAAVTVVDANVFTMALATNPGSATALGWMQPSYVFGIAPDSFAASGTGDIEIEYPYVAEMEGYPAGFVPEYVPRSRIPADRYWYGAGVDGVRYYNTLAAWQLDATTGAITRSVGMKLSTTRGVALYAQTQSLVPRRLAEFLGGWTKSDASMTVTDSADLSPLGTLDATRVQEGTGTGRHQVELPGGVLTTANTANAVLSTISVYLATPGAATGRDWATIGFVDRAGTEQTTYVNLATGQVGTSTAGIRNVHMEPLTIGSTPYWRVHCAVTTGTGSTAPVLRVGLASGNGGNSYTGTGTRYIVAWGVAFCGGTLARPTAAPYGRAHQEILATLGGAALQYDMRGIVGYGRLTALDVCTPYYRAQQVDKVEYSATLYFRPMSPQFVSSATSNNVAPVPMDRFGIVIRPNASPGSATHRRWAIDHYNGDPNAFYMFQEGAFYKPGDAVIPTDTLPNNDNARYLYNVVAVTGPAGTEPAWPIPTSLPSAPVTSGGVTFQVIHDNGLIGKWEPYNGAHSFPPNDFMAEIRNAFFIGENDYGFAMNGEPGVKQTEPQPVNPEYKYDMRFPIRTLHVGQLGNPLGYDPATLTPYLGIDAAGLMPRLTSFHKNIYVWNAESGPTGLIELTEQPM